MEIYLLEAIRGCWRVLEVEFSTLSVCFGKNGIELDFSCRFQICMIQGHPGSSEVIRSKIQLSQIELGIGAIN